LKKIFCVFYGSPGVACRPERGRLVGKDLKFHL